MATSEEKKAYNRAFYARKGHVKRREYNLRAHYGIGVAEFDAMLVQQDGACAICRKVSTDRLRVDHDHKTGAVRALLCTTCNIGLGAFQDDPLLMEQAAHYIRSRI